MRSIRHALLARLVGGLFLLLLAGAATLSVVVHRRLVADFDSALLARARALVALTSREGNGIEIDYSGEHLPEFEDEEAPEYFEIRFANGTRMARSPLLPRDALPAQAPPSGEPVFVNWRLPDGREGRVVRILFRPRVDPGEESGDPEDGAEAHLFSIPAGVDPAHASLIMIAARGRETLNTALLTLYLTLAGGTALMLAGCAVLVHRVTIAALRPIDEIGEQVSRIGPDRLGDRIGLTRPPRELRAIIDGANLLLERLQRAFERERRFSSDVAHELRTPVSELRVACEVGAQWPDDPAEVRAFFTDIREIAVQMETTINNLLMLAGCESGKITVETETVDLAGLVHACWERARAGAGSRDVSCTFSIDDGTAVRTDRAKLELVLHNLLGNAAAYAAEGSVVHCAVRNGGSSVELSIENRVTDLDAADLPHVFDRFWRKDPARSGNGHSGLGLSIARALTDLLGVTLQVRLNEPDVFCARLSFVTRD